MAVWIFCQPERSSTSREFLTHLIVMSAYVLDSIPLAVRHWSTRADID